MQVTDEERTDIIRLIPGYIAYRTGRYYGIRTAAMDQIAAALRAYPPEKVQRVAEDMLAAADPDIRFSGGRMLLLLDWQQYLPCVLELLNDPDDDVRGSFTMLLVGYPDQRAVPALLRILQHDPNASARRYAADAVGAIGDPQALPTLYWAMEHDQGIAWENMPVADAAEEAIAAIQAKCASANKSSEGTNEHVEL